MGKAPDPGAGRVEPVGSLNPAGGEGGAFASQTRILEAVSDFVCCLDSGSRRILYLNRAARTLMGLPAEADVTRLRHVDLYAEETIRLFEKEAFRLAVCNGAWNGEGFLRGPNGRGIPVSIALVAQGLGEGPADRLVSICRELDLESRERVRLQERVDGLQRVLDHFQEGLIVLDRAGIVRSANRSFFEITGYGEDEIIGRFFMRLPVLVSGRRLQFWRTARGLFRGGSATAIEFEYRHANGEIRQVVARAYAIRKNQMVDGFEVLIRDVTDLKRAEEAQRYSEARLQTLAALAPVGIYFTDRDGSCLYANPAWCRMAGMTLEEARGPGWSRGLHPDDREFVLNSWKQMVESRGKWGLEYRFRTPEGKVTLVYGLAAPQHDAEGRIIRYVGVNLDITDRKKAEEALRESEYFFKESQRAAFIGSYKVDFITSLWESSEVLDGIFGIDADFRRSIKNWLEIVHPDDREMMERYLYDEVIAKRRPFNKEYRIVRRSDGQTRWVNGLGQVKINGEGVAVSMIGTIQDITERKKTEALLQNSQKLEALGVLAGGIAHDFNNLMGGLFGYIDLARAECEEDRVCAYLSKAMNTIDRARGLTAQLLTFAKGGVPLKRMASLVPFLEETAQFALSGSNVSCRCQFEKGLWSCFMDRNQIGQVVDNIVINAQQAMPSGGTVQLFARNLALGEGEHLSLGAGRYVKISIQDSGVGIPRDILPRIFDPFYSTKAKGHGLGLATCYSIIKRHGGCIEAESEAGKGATFHVYLPASAETGAEKPASLAIQGGGGRVILMDDEAVIRDATGAMLESAGYTVARMRDGLEVLEYLEEETRAGRAIAAVILDLTVPGGMGGREAGAEIRKRYATVPIFVASGYADDPVLKNPQEYGFVASISKPFKKEELLHMLGRNLSKPG